MKLKGRRQSKNVEVVPGSKFERTGPSMNYGNRSDKTRIKDKPILGTLEDAMASSLNPWDREAEKRSPKARQFNKGKRLSQLQDSAKPKKLSTKNKIKPTSFVKDKKKKK